MKDEGFAIRPGVAGIPTAFVAEWGPGGAVIGLLAEFDALPGIFNQSASPTRDPVKGLGEHAPPQSMAYVAQPWEVVTGYGSTDVGDVSRAVPTGSVYTVAWVPGTSAHSWQTVAGCGPAMAPKVLSMKPRR